MTGLYLSAGVLQFAVNFLLICAVSMLMGSSGAHIRALAASALGALSSVALILVDSQYAGILYGFSMVLICAVAFGISRVAICSGLVFCLIKIGLENMGNDSIFWLLPLCAGIALALVWQKKHDLYVPVELSYGGKTVNIMAFRDTGHHLRDPISGKEVLVVDSEVAKKLTGLSQEQLNHPVDNLAKTVGLRLIPFRSVGCSAGFLLAVSAEKTVIGGNRKNCVVAMAPQVLDENGRFQALMGGTL